MAIDIIHNITLIFKNDTGVKLGTATMLNHVAQSLGAKCVDVVWVYSALETSCEYIKCIVSINKYL